MEPANCADPWGQHLSNCSTLSLHYCRCFDCVQEAQQRIEASLQAAGIKPWELSSVDNSNCADAPLDPSLMALA